MTDSDPDNDPATTDSETTFYEYDLYGNLLSVVLPDGRTIEYEVDGAGRRVGRRELDIDGNRISFKGWIYRDLLRPIAEVNEAGNVVARYIYGDGAGARQNGLKQVGTRLGANQDASLPFWGSNVPEAIEFLDGSGGVMQTISLVTNQVGSVQLVTDADTGDVLQRTEYDAFGRVVFDSSPRLQPFGFAGGIHDLDTGFVRFGARDYENNLGRWTGRDPSRMMDGPNLYAYAQSDPVGRVDANGLWSCWKEQAGVSLCGVEAVVCILEPTHLSCITAAAACALAIDALEGCEAKNRPKCKYISRRAQPGDLGAPDTQEECDRIPGSRLIMVCEGEPGYNE